MPYTSMIQKYMCHMYILIKKELEGKYVFKVSLIKLKGYLVNFSIYFFISTYLLI